MEVRAVLALITCTILLTAGCSSCYMQFEPVLVPKTAETGQSTQCSAKVTYGKLLKGAFRKVARTTEDHNCILPGCQRVGEVLDIQRSAVGSFNRDTLEPTVKNVTKVDISHYPSGGVLLQEEDIGRWFMLYQFEKPNPGTVYRMLIRLENDTDLSSRLNVPLNFAPWGGLWKPRVAIPTPSNTMMGAEGSPPDGKLYDAVKCMQDEKKTSCLVNMDREGFIDIVEFMRYFGKSPEDLKEEGKLKLPPRIAIPGFKPYRYGFPYEVSLELNEDDRVVDKISKLYALGRTGAKGIALMQDGFTVYLSGGKGTLFKFITDSESSSGYTRGELFAAVFRLKGHPFFDEIRVGTTFSIDWILLGTTDSDSIAEFVGPQSTLEFREIFETADAEEAVCPEGFLSIHIAGVTECLKMLDPELATVFEPERTAALMGATVGVFQFSQMATLLDSNRFYLAASEILEGSVEVDKTGGSPVRVRVPSNECGCVFEVRYNEFFNAHTMRAIACGGSEEGKQDGCNSEGIANPRSLTFVNAFEYLLIGEDSEHHENNFVWAWDPDTGRSTRIFHAAALGGITSLSWFQGVVGGNNYIGITISKPVDVFGWLSYFGSFDLATKQDMVFSGVPVPYKKGPKRLPIAFKRFAVGKSEIMGSFKELFRTGQKIRRTGTMSSEIELGGVVNKEFQAVKSYKTSPVQPVLEDSKEIHHRFAHTSLIEMCGRMFSIAAIGSIPGVSYTVSMKKVAGGEIQVVSADYNDWSKWGGLWQSGGGSVTPWNSHLGGEINEPDSLDFIGYPCLAGFSSCFQSRAKKAFETSLQFIRYFNKSFSDLSNSFGKLLALFNPYNYGYAYEIGVNKFGCTSTTKLMTLGRFSHGDVAVMPDGKTVYMADHTTGRENGAGFFRFIAEKEHDLSTGTLYAAKLHPIEIEKFSVKWIELGTASNPELRMKSKSIKFTDMFDFIPAAKKCRLKTVNIKSSVECIDYKTETKKWGAFFETRRFAALRGATIEFANVRGLTFDTNTMRLFMAISRITNKDKVMIQDDLEGSSNDIKVPTAGCGILYEMLVQKSNLTDFDVNIFQKSYRGAANLADVDENKCSLEEPSNPGPISSIPGHNQLIVGEDSCQVGEFDKDITCGHENNAVWAMDAFRPKEGKEEDRQKTRILTTPPKTGLGSVDWYPNLGGAGFLSAAVNNLYGDEFDVLVDSKEPGAVFGYMGPFKKKEADQRSQEIKATEPKCYDSKSRKGSSYQCPNNRIFV